MPDPVLVNARHWPLASFVSGQVADPRLGPPGAPCAAFAEQAASHQDDLAQGRPWGGANRTLLLPYSGSGTSEMALEAAVEFATTAPVEVAVLHVREWSTFRGARFFLETQAEALALTCNAVERLRLSRVMATGFVRDAARSQVAREIVAQSIGLRAVAILVGARRRRALSTLLFGSVSSSVIWHAHSPVIVVHPDEHRAQPMNRLRWDAGALVVDVGRAEN